MLSKLNPLSRNSPTKTLYKNTTNTRVILVRHGQSTYNAEGRHQGSGDESRLTQFGRNCAYQTGIFLRGLDIDVLYGSPLKRTRETAHEILAGMNLVPDDLKGIYHPSALREIDLPAWQGLLKRDVPEKFADDYHCWKQRPHQFRMTASQTIAQQKTIAKEYCFPVLDLYQRAQKFWQDILPRHSGQTLLIVGHSGTNRALISTAMGLTPDRYHALQQSNCGISILNFPNGYGQKAQLEALNMTTHLEEMLPKPKGNPQGLRLLLVPSGITNPKQTQKLANLIKKESIDFSINGDFPHSQITSEQILQCHPKAVQLQVLRQDFLQVWQQTIEAKRSAMRPSQENSQQLVTGLVLARETTLKHLISHVLGIGSDQSNYFPLHQGTISLIHYPSSKESPMLQSLNINTAQLTKVAH